MLNIRLSDRYVDYEFIIQDKFTLVRGDTATGKTTLYDLFRLYSDNPANVRCLSYKNLDVLPNLKRYDLYDNVLSTTNSTVYILDEGHPIFAITGFEKLLLNTDNYFIIIAREKLFKNLPIHLRSILSVNSSRRYHTLKPMYTVPEEMHEFTRCLCEDSKSGRQFLEQFIPNTVSCSGKDNIAKTILSCEESLLLVYDTAGIGESYKGILKAIKRHKNPITHLAWESFESHLIDNTVYKNAPRGEYSCSYESYEKYAEQVLSDALHAYPGINYDKSKLPQCLRKNRCTVCGNTSSCPYVMCGDTALLNDRIKKLIDLSKVESSTEHLSPELIESVWSQMPEVVKPMYGSTKEEIATNYYKEYSYLFK